MAKKNGNNCALNVWAKWDDEREKEMWDMWRKIMSNEHIIDCDSFT